MLHHRLLDEFLQVMQLLRQVFVDVRALGVGHLENGVPLRVENLDLFAAKVQLLPCLCNLLLYLNKTRVERSSVFTAG